MKRKTIRGKTEKLSISLPVEMAQWLRRAAAKRMGTVSSVIKQGLWKEFEARHC